MEEKKSKNIIGFILLVLAAVFCAGAFTILSGCAQEANGTWMDCHWAGQALKGVTIVIAALVLLALILPGKGVKAGIYIGVLANAGLAAAIPYYLFDLCTLSDMNCRRFMLPVTLGLSAAIALLALINAIVMAARSRSETKKKVTAAREEVEMEARKREAQKAAESLGPIPDSSQDLKAPWEREEYLNDPNAK
ncbi:MAG: DUF4418 family protein [Mogibacterium sp.]|nr:DUF4418 family protein [Mogibacterium sp.]